MDSCQSACANTGEPGAAWRRLVPIFIYQRQRRAIHRVRYNKYLRVEQLDFTWQCEGNFPRPIPIHRHASNELSPAVLSSPLAVIEAECARPRAMPLGFAPNKWMRTRAEPL